MREDAPNPTRDMIDQGWHHGRLEEVVEILDSRRVPVNAAERATRSGTVPYYGATGQVGWIDDFLFDEELVLVGEDGAPFLEAGRPKAYVIKGKSWVNNHAHVLRALRGTPAAFWKYQLDQVDYRRFVSGTTRLKLPQAPMRQIPILVPPLREQHRIVAAIDSYFSHLDEAVATLERVQRNLKRYGASVLKAAVEGRLVPTEAELARAEGREYEHASVLLKRILAERRRRWEESGRRGRYEEPVPPDTSDLPEVPEGWCWTTMAGVTVNDAQNGIYVPKSRYGRGTPILRISDFQADWSRSSGELKRVDISPADALAYGLGIGDLVVNRVNSLSHLGKLLAVDDRHLPAVFESNMMRLKIAAGLHPRFLQNYLTSGEGKGRLLRNAKWAVNQASINQTDVAGTPVPLPPSNEQHRVLAEVERLFSAAGDTLHSIGVQEHRCSRLRQAILKWAFEGKLADQDPSDEPASVLLERIRTERAAEGEWGRRKSPSRRGRVRRGRSPVDAMA